MSQLTYPRTAEAIATRARMILAAYRAAPARQAAHQLERSLHDMWSYGYFALRNDDPAPWAQTSQRLFNALQLLKPAADQPSNSARAVADAIPYFEQTAGIVPGAAPEPLYTRTEAEQAAHAAFECLSRYIKLDHDHDHDRQLVTRAFLAFLDNPDSPYPYKSHDLDDEEDGGVRAEPELSPEETGERDNALLYWLGPRAGTTPGSS
ncbi:hypothetical protein ACFV19_31845 [Streptomyces griseoluteus]|uniref:hypothetical protein n=1 Tax=Streptomyces griseoluteus TaxID=29306 RepID=UPI0036A327F4